jgi:hypothetical protein
MSGTHGRVAEGLGQKGLTQADRAGKEHTLVAVEEVQGDAPAMSLLSQVIMEVPTMVTKVKEDRMTALS